jgi:isoquinoline 1-oxidoreductase subunit alpha
MPNFILSVNGIQHRLSAAPEMPLLWVLRDLLHLTGTKYGCGIGACGACTVHQDGAAVRSCQVQLSATAGKKYTTIEGLSAQGDHPCQLAWVEEDVSQCGYCQPGMIMEAAALLRHRAAVAGEQIIDHQINHQIDDAEIDASLRGHVCRCGTYQRVRRAVRRASHELASREQGSREAART